MNIKPSIKIIAITMAVTTTLSVIFWIIRPNKSPSALPLSVLPLTTDPTIPSKSIYFNTFLESQDIKYILTHNNLLFGVTDNEIIDLQTKKVVLNLTGIKVLNLNSEAILLKEENRNTSKILRYPFSNIISLPNASNFSSPVINQEGSGIIECSAGPRVFKGDAVLKSKIKIDSLSCFWGSNDVVVIQGGNLTYLWDIKSNTKISIMKDDGEKSIYATKNTLFTNKGGVLGIRTIDSVRGVPFHKGSSLNILTIDQELGSVIILEVTQEDEVSRGYIYELKIINGIPSRANIIGSTHPIPDGIDPLYSPLYLPKYAIFVVRTVSGKYWLGSLIPTKLPYHSITGPELYEPGGMSFSEDPNDLKSSSFSE